MTTPTPDSGATGRSATGSPAVILDRDGTLHHDAVYMIRFEDFVPLPGVEEALRLLRDKGYRLFGATNQSGVARGKFALADVEALNARIRAYFASHGADIEEIAVCPHLPAAEGGTVAEYARACDCRKPGPGMLHDLARRHGLDLARSYMVGDMERDVRAGLAAGARAVWIPGPGKTPAIPEKLADLDSSGRFKDFERLLDFAKAIPRAV